MNHRPTFHRCKNNPILEPGDFPGPAMAVLNPGAIEHDGRVALLVRVENASGFSDIYTAWSDNGVDGWRFDPEPLLGHGDPDYPYEQWGCEDARVVWIEEKQRYYITYTAFSRNGAATAMARSADLHTAERLMLIQPPNNKDAVLFDRRVCGEQWMMLHRPDAGGIEHIWTACSKDLEHWGDPRCLLPERDGPSWDNEKVGAGPPPVLTEHGWLLLYHGVKQYAGHHVYRAGVALLDRDDPHRVIARCPQAIFQAEASYEKTGLVPNIVFPTGLLVRGEDLWVYYGAADTTVCLAIAKLDAVVEQAMACKV